MNVKMLIFVGHFNIHEQQKKSCSGVLSKNVFITAGPEHWLLTSLNFYENIKHIMKCLYYLNMRYVRTSSVVSFAFSR